MSDGAHEIAWSPTALRNLGSLPEKAAAACIELVFGAIAENPRRVGRELRLELAGHWSARRGDYRVIFVIDDEARRVSIVAVQHRSDVYRRR